MILDDIVAKTRIRVEKDKENISEQEMIAAAKQTVSKLPAFAFEHALHSGDISFICEVKKASPSKGLIAPDFPYVQIAKDYEKSGASCISVLTEPDFFQGSNQYLTEIKEAVHIPVIRKDFVVDAYQIYQAKVIGADAVLLICAVLGQDTIRAYLSICDELGLSALVEAHDEQEIEAAIAAGARIIGVNNRNLKDFTVDIHNSMRLRKLVPNDVLFVAESGIRTGADIEELRSANVNGVLIGETLMRAKDKTRMLNELRGTKVKICGLTRAEDIAMVNEWKPDYIGFVFADSKRHVTDEQAKKLRSMLDDRVRAAGRLTVVGVFVNDTIEHIVRLCEDDVIDMVQLHGDEDEAYLQELRTALNRMESVTKKHKQILQAIRVKDSEALHVGAISSADYVLLDTYHKDTYGGTGESFDSGLIPEGYRPYFLAGGISVENVQEKIKTHRPYAVDVSSGVETAGVKDYNKVKEFIEKVREMNE